MTSGEDKTDGRVVWIALDDDLSHGGEIIGVYSTEEKARLAAEQYADHTPVVVCRVLDQ